MPDVVQLNSTNANDTVYGSAHLAVEHCTEDWGRPPNFLLVDYYNYGDPGPGSVFEVAARWNNVTYNRACCGADANGAALVHRTSIAMVLAVMVLTLFVSW